MCAENIVILAGCAVVFPIYNSEQTENNVFMISCMPAINFVLYVMFIVCAVILF